MQHVTLINRYSARNMQTPALYQTVMSILVRMMDDPMAMVKNKRMVLSVLEAVLLLALDL